MTRGRNSRELLEKTLHVQFTKVDYAIVVAWFEQSTCQSISEYIRKVVLRKPGFFRIRNETMERFLETAVDLKNEFHGAIEAGGCDEMKRVAEEVRILMIKIYRECGQK